MAAHEAHFVTALAAYGIDLDEGAPETIVEAIRDSDQPEDLRLSLDYLRLYLAS